VIGADERAKIEELIALAQAEPITLAELEDWSKGFDPENPRSRDGKRTLPLKFTIDLPVGFTVTYTHEQQPPGLARHLSVSVEGGKLPNIVAVDMILKEFGFRQTVATADRVWPENYGAGLTAINVLEVMVNGNA
jgi:hypothetical protein